MLDNKSAQVQALAEGQKVTDTIVITVDDGKGGKATQTVTVEVTGTNDAPTIGGTATGAVKEDAVVNTTSGQLTKTDVDTNDVHTGPSPTTAMASTASSPSTRRASGPHAGQQQRQGPGPGRRPDGDRHHHRHGQ